MIRVTAEAECAVQIGDTVDQRVRSEEALVCMGRSRLLATLMLLYGWKWLLLLTIATVATACIGIFIDLRWMVIALMLIFIVTPLLMAFLYFYHGLKPMTAVNVVPHMITPAETGVAVVIPKPETNGSLDATGAKRGERRVFYRFSSFQNILSGSSGYLMMSLSRDKGFLWVPYSIFNDENQSGDFMRSFRDSQPKP